MNDDDLTLDQSAHTLVEACPAGMALFDHELRAIRVNSALAASFGFSVRDAPGRNLSELLPDLEVLAQPARAVLETGQPLLQLEVASSRNPGQRWLVSCFAAPPGVGVTIAPAPARRAEVDESEAIFHAIFDHAATAMIVMDWRGGGVRANRAFRELLGYSEAELSALSVQGITHPDDLTADQAEYQRLMAGEIDHYRILKRYLRKDAGLFWGQLIVSLARDHDGKPLLVIAMIEDVTERRRAEEDRERAIRTLEEAVRARETFLAVTSHELKTPLTPLILSLELVRLRLQNAPQAPVAEVDIAIQQVGRLETLVRTLLDVSTIAAGRLVLTRAPVDLSALAGEVVESFRATAQRVGSQLTLASPGPVQVSADSVRIQQVVRNVLSNALKFGAGAPIEVTVSAGEGVARLQIRDRGVGVADADRERIFGRFERAAAELRYAGLGLGLYISREIMAAHGGSIEILPGTGDGATFVVELPI